MRENGSALFAGEGIRPRVVVFRTGHLGDTVCAIPAFRLLRAHFKEAVLCLLCDEPVPGKVAARDVIGRLRIFDRIVSYRSSAGWRTFRDLFLLIRRLRPDVLIQLPQLHRTQARLRKQARFFRLAGARRLYGFHPPVCADEWHPNEPLRLVQLLNAEGITGESPDYAIPFDNQAFASVRRKMRKLGLDPAGPYLVFCGGGKAPTQRWPLDRHGAVLERLAHETGVAVVGVGAPADVEEYGREITAKVSGRGLVSFAPALGELSELLRFATAYIGNDTGPMHLAAAVGCPVIAIMSARNKPGQWDPDVKPRLLIRQRTECEGCWLEHCPEENHRCMTAITVNSVLERAVPFVRSLSFARMSPAACHG